MVIFLKTLGFLFILAGGILVFGAKKIVSRFKLDRDAKCDFTNEMTEEELELYKMSRAIVNVKMLGMLVSLPGLILTIILFR